MSDIINTKFHHEGKEYHVVVSEPLGAGGGYYVYVDNYYRGSIVKSPDGWLPCIESTLLTSDDIGAILDVINKKGR